MKLPALVDYRDAVHQPSTAFLDPILRTGRARLNQLGMPVVASGGFALTFDITAAGHRYAVRCFHKQGNHLQQRYDAIARFVRGTSTGFLIDVDYVVPGIRINGQGYPIVRMNWVDGLPLSSWVDDNLNAPQALDSVRQQIVAAATALRRLGVAHGDLQHGNIMVDKRNRIWLVDYDGMFLPALRDLGAAEYGHRNYQHPGRGEHYDENLDLFAAYVIDLSLSAIKQYPGLWDEFHDGDNLVLTAADFIAPSNSDLLTRLSRHPAFAERVRRLTSACLADFGSVPTILSGGTPTAARATTTGSTRTLPKAAPAPLLAHDRAALLDRIGDDLTVIGRVTNVKRHTSPATGKKTTFINFGDFRQGAFAIVAFDRVSRELTGEFGDSIEDGSWVAITGLLELYKSRWSKELTPEIELERVRSLRRLNPNQIEEFLTRARAKPQQPAAAPTVRKTPTAPVRPPAPTSDDREQRLAKLYAKPGFVNTPNRNTPTPPKPSPTFVTPLPRQPVHQPSAQAQQQAPKPRPGLLARLRRKLGL